MLGTDAWRIRRQEITRTTDRVIGIRDCTHGRARGQVLVAVGTMAVRMGCYSAAADAQFAKQPARPMSATGARAATRSTISTATGNTVSAVTIPIAAPTATIYVATVYLTVRVATIHIAAIHIATLDIAAIHVADVHVACMAASATFAVTFPRAK